MQMFPWLKSGVYLARNQLRVVCLASRSLITEIIFGAAKLTTYHPTHCHRVPLVESNFLSLLSHFYTLTLTSFSLKPLELFPMSVFYIAIKRVEKTEAYDV